MATCTWQVWDNTQTCWFGNRNKVHLANLHLRLAEKELAFLERLAGKCSKDAAAGFAQAR